MSKKGSVSLVSLGLWGPSSKREGRGGFCFKAFGRVYIIIIIIIIIIVLMGTLNDI